MSKPIEFFFDFGSPTSYLAWTQLPALAAGIGAPLVYRPMLLGGVFKATGNQPPGVVKAKGAWMLGDLQLWARKWGVPLVFNPHFPVRTLGIMRGAAAALANDELIPYGDAMLKAMWVDGRNPSEPEVFAAVVESAGLDAALYGQRIQDPAVKQALFDTTDEAVARGVFGAPTMIVGDDLFFGQDRLDFVAEAAA